MGKTVKPISPLEARNQKLQEIPDQVLEAFNEMIAKKLSNGGYSTFTLDEVRKLAIEKFVKTGKYSPKSAADKISEHHWMDVERLYEQAGWDVDYDQPAYNETYAAKFTFKSKRSGSIE